jgi:hypothetical protein
MTTFSILIKWSLRKTGSLKKLTVSAIYVESPIKARAFLALTNAIIATSVVTSFAQTVCGRRNSTQEIKQKKVKFAIFAAPNIYTEKYKRRFFSSSNK